MNVENIEVGKTYKNYKELCEALEVTPKGGKGKSFQLLDFRRYFDYDKEDGRYSYTITSIRDIPLEKIPRSYSPYTNLIKLLVLDLVAQSNDNNFISFTKSKLFYVLSLVNEDFLKYRTKYKKLSNILKVNEKTISVFYSRHSSNFKSIVETALNQLEKDRVIYYNKVMRVAIDSYYNRILTDYEKSILLKLQTDTMKELGYKSFQELYLNEEYDILAEITTEKFNKYFDDNILFYFETYDIIYNADKSYINMQKEISKHILENDYKITLQYNLNGLVIDKIKENVLKRTDNDYYIENEIKIADKIIKK